MTNHTPGPWHRNIRANGKYPTVFAGRNQHVAVVKQQNNADETEANIDLVAAAPDLLAQTRMLAWLLSELHGGNEFSKDQLWEWYQTALENIRRATGVE